MANRYNSSSAVQVESEKIIFKTIENRLGVSLDANVKLYLNSNPYTHIEPDFYSEKELIVGEIYSHIGEIKTGQKHKFTNDILKLITFEKAKGIKYRKIIVVCDDFVEKYLAGNSVLAESIRLFDIEVVRIDIDKELYTKILSVQKKQKMVNA